jgi:hypothetical protein
MDFFPYNDSVQFIDDDHHFIFHGCMNAFSGVVYFDLQNITQQIGNTFHQAKGIINLEERSQDNLSRKGAILNIFRIVIAMP